MPAHPGLRPYASDVNNGDRARIPCAQGSSSASSEDAGRFRPTGPSVLWAVHRRRGRIKVRPRNRPELEVPYSIAHQLSLLADLQGARLEEVRGDLAKLRLPEGILLWVRLNRDSDVGHVLELFVDRAYGSSFSGTVVDVHESNGDSAVFFAFNGAERVVALEPDPESLALA